jgi:hypothetical protein
MKASQEKQNELLAFTSKLTGKNTQLSTENVNLAEKLEQLQKDLDLTNISLKELNVLKKQEVI